MIKLIPVAQLKPGMFLHALNDSRRDHPLWRNEFLLEGEHVRMIVDSGVSEVWIDESQGLDAPDGQTREAVQQAVELELFFAVTAPLPLIDPPPSAPGPASDHLPMMRLDWQALPPTPPAPSAEPRTAIRPPLNLQRATALCLHGQAVLRALFHDVRLQREPDYADCIQLVHDIDASVVQDPGALISVARAHRQTECTFVHLVSVCALMLSLARKMGFNARQTHQAGLAGLLHDIGKAFIPSHILDKPDQLTAAEYDVIRTHAARGHEVLARSAGRLPPMVLAVCLQHHERMDGRGYPHQLEGHEISLFARMASVCDVYDALTSHRPYKDCWDPGETLRQMAQWKGQFDPVVFQAFVQTVGLYPMGTLVRLESGLLAVVVAQTEDQPLKPKVKVCHSPRDTRNIDLWDLDLAARWCKDQIVGVEIPDDPATGPVERLWAATSVCEAP
ncbi:HD-GYP domain-containing protein [Methylibium petroleiphilum]|uniref:HD-GYP domain-containing protein n=1 Tax=Methylibium petroleiphilum TaxID=105560 RepID=UPI003D2B8445